MAQQVFRINLGQSTFPLHSAWGGQAVVDMAKDQNFVSRSTLAGKDADLDRGIAHIQYAHNILPVGQGYKSVHYRFLNLALSPASVGGVVQYAVGANVLSNGLILMFTSGGYMITYTLGAYGVIAQNTTFPRQMFTIHRVQPLVSNLNGTDWTFVSDNLQSPGTGVDYRPRIYTASAVILAPTGLPATGVTIIPGDTATALTCAGYLILITRSGTMYYSAPGTIDFTPSLATGAGVFDIQEVTGTVIYAAKLGTGFAIYTTREVILASYTGNIQYPWTFRPASDSAGVSSPAHVTITQNAAKHYAYTSGGLMEIQVSGCRIVFPEVTDFLAGNLYEYYDQASDSLIQQRIDRYVQPLQVKLSLIGKRFLIISYGLEALHTTEVGATGVAAEWAEYTMALVYDIGQGRWGKLKVPHTDVIELDGSFRKLEVNVDTTAWENRRVPGFTVDNYADDIDKSTGEANKLAGFLDKSGRIQLLDVTDNVAPGTTTILNDSVLILGKYQWSRVNICVLEEIDLETFSDANLGIMDLKVWSYLYGSEVTYKTSPLLVRTTTHGKKWLGTPIAQNHSLVIRGTFHMSNGIIRFSQQGDTE